VVAGGGEEENREEERGGGVKKEEGRGLVARVWCRKIKRGEGAGGRHESGG
jgi:hypothetical protein